MACCRISAQPDWWLMIDGQPTCIASSGLIPKGSLTDGMIYTSLIANISCTCLPRMKPGKWNLSAMPRLATRSIISVILSPLPAITNRTPSVLLNTLAAASTKYSGPFCIVIRPRNVTSLSLRSGFVNSSGCANGSTALCTVLTLRGSMPYFSITVRLVRLLTHMI